jgi:IS5 family transposase
LGCHTECQDSRLGSTARLLHLCRLGLDSDVPDHSTFSKNRHGRFRESDLLRKLFDTIFRSGLWAKSGVH